MRIEALLVNGRILTMDLSRPEVEALALAAGRVVATGATAELLPRRDKETRVIDLGGRFACPGFIDAHNHLGMTALAPVEVDCRTPPLTTIAQIVERMRDAVQSLPAGAWVRGHGYDEEQLRERRHPTRAELDEAAPSHPVVLVHWSVHRCVLNSAALAALGIGAETPDPPGGWIVRGRDGVPAGPLYETATNQAQSRSIAAYAERFATQAPELFGENARRYLAFGITSTGDAYVSPALHGLYRQALAGGPLPIDITGYGGSAEGLFAPSHEWLREAPEVQVRRGGPGERAALDSQGIIAGIKLFADGGGNTTATSLVGEHAHRGVRWRFYEQAELDAVVTAALGARAQVAVHAAGDMAVAMALTAMERARHQHPRAEPHFRIEHGVLLSDALIERMARVGAALVVQPVSVYYHAEKLVAAPLAEGLRQLPLRDLLEAGVPIAFSSDAPCYPMDPLIAVRAAVTRQTLGGSVHTADQCLTVEESLRCATTGAARALGTHAHEGTLSPGMLANVAVLSDDPRSCPVEALGDVHVIETYRRGVRAYQRDHDAAAAPVGRLP